jgi:hypothetical protein
MPQEYNLVHNGVALSPTQRFTGFTVKGAKGLLTTAHARSAPFVKAQLLGSLAYVRASDRWGPFAADTNNTLVWVKEMAAFSIRHTMAIMSPSNAGFNSTRGFNLPDPGMSSYYTGPIDLQATNITSVRGSLGDTFDNDWTVSNTSVGTSLAAVADPWTTTGAGANLCKRYVNGVLTSEPLWPWPMNQRIKDATAAAGRYAGPCPNCLGGRATRRATDVEADIEALLGTIPDRCKR